MGVIGCLFPLQMHSNRENEAIPFGQMQSRVHERIRNDSGVIEAELMNNQLRPEQGRGIAGSQCSPSFHHFSFQWGRAKSCLNGFRGRNQISFLFFFVYALFFFFKGKHQQASFPTKRHILRKVVI